MTEYIGKSQRDNYERIYHDDPNCPRTGSVELVEAKPEEIKDARPCAICGDGIRARDIRQMGETG